MLDLRENSITGTIPTEIGKSSNLNYIYFESNSLQQNIPSELGNLNRLIYMNVSDNLLTGFIPIELDNIRSLEGLTLNQNSFTGSLEHFCDNNLTTGTYTNETHHYFQSYTYSVTSGILIDCVDNRPIIECSCCIC